MERDDDALVNRAAAGDEESFADLVKRHIDSVWRVASGMTRNRADVEEVCQNALIRLWRQLPDFRGECDFRTRLKYTVVHCGIDLLRLRERQAVSDSAAEALLPIDSDPEALACASETERTIHRAIQEDLTEAERTAFTLRHGAGLGIPEISARMDTSETAARQAVYRAMLKLQKVTHASDQRTSHRLRFRR